MEFFGRYWFFILVLLFCVGIHLFGHGHGHDQGHAHGHDKDHDSPNKQ